MTYLRAIEPEDLDLMYIVENDPQVQCYSSTTVPLSRYALRQYISESRGDLYADAQVRMAIMDPDSGEACGFLDITDFVPQHHRAQIGIALLPDAQGRGIATGALNEAAVYAYGKDLHQLYAVVSSENRRGCMLFLRSGYNEISVLPHWLQQNGRFVDAVLYQKILKDE